MFDHPLAGYLPETLAELQAGRLSWSRVRVIADFASLLDNTDPDVMRRYEDYVLKHADEQTTGELREVCGRAVLMIDPKAGEKKRRKVTLTLREDGMAELGALAGHVADLTALADLESFLEWPTDHHPDRA